MSAQLEPCDELIIVDDSESFDGTGYDDLSCHNPRILGTGGAGPATARNAGVRIASGDVVCFTDDDVCLGDRWIEAARSEFRADDEIVAIEGHTWTRPFDPLYEYSVESTSGRNGLTCNVAYRRSALEALGGFDEQFRFAHCEDVDLFARAKRLGKARYLPEMTVEHPPREVTVRAIGARARWISSERRLFVKHRDLKRYPLPPLVCAIVTYVRLPLSLIRTELTGRPDPARIVRVGAIAAVWWFNLFHALILEELGLTRGAHDRAAPNMGDSFDRPTPPRPER